MKKSIFVRQIILILLLSQLMGCMIRSLINDISDATKKSSKPNYTSTAINISYIGSPGVKGSAVEISGFVPFSEISYIYDNKSHKKQLQGLWMQAETSWSGGFDKSRPSLEKGHFRTQRSVNIQRAQNSVYWTVKLWRVYVPEEYCSKGHNGSPCSHCKQYGYHLEDEVLSRTQKIW